MNRPWRLEPRYPIHVLTGYDEDVVAAFQLEREPGLIAVFLLALLP